jgi:hypothetical protein
VALINHRSREVHFKIVYYGPSLGGKTTNLKILHERLPTARRGRLMSIATDHERTLFFDFLPLSLGLVHGYTTRIHLYTTPGQGYYRLSRRAVLQGVDGLVFVADSHPAREAANVESLRDLAEHLDVMGVVGAEREKLAWVVQYNKRDLSAAMPIERMRRVLGVGASAEVEAIAIEGHGVAETLRAVCKGVIASATGVGGLAGGLGSVAGVGGPRTGSSGAKQLSPGTVAPSTGGSTLRAGVSAPRRGGRA